MSDPAPCPFCGAELEYRNIRGHWMLHHPLTGCHTETGYHKECILDDHMWPVTPRNIELWNRRTEA